MNLTLSQVRGWDTEHLTSAAHHWSATANRWDDAFAQLEQLTHMPGGRPWEGVAARAAQDRAHADRRRVSAAADQLHTASSVASRAAGELLAAQRRLLAVVDAAEAVGLTVGEDFSLTTYRVDAQVAAAEADMREVGRLLRDRIEELLELDQQVASRIAVAAAGVGTLEFVEDKSQPAHNEQIQAVDNRVLKEAPPQPPPPDPTPGRLPPVTGADDVRRVLDPLQNGGRRGPNSVGTKPKVKEIWDESSTRRLWDYLTRNSTEGATPPEYKGAVRALPDGTRIGLRRSEEWGDTIDVWYPNDTDRKAHTPYEPYFPPFISGPPQVPPTVGTPSVQVLPPQLTHPPTALPPAGIFEPNGLPPWLQNPSAPGLHIPAQPPTIMPGVALPDVPQTSAPAPGQGSDISVMGDAFVDAGEAVGGVIVEGGQAVGTVIVGGVVIIGGVLGTVATPSGQLAR